MAYEELKQRQSAMWGKGRYQRLPRRSPTSTTSCRRLGPTRASAGSISPVAPGPSPSCCGSGAKVTGVDLAPALIETARSGCRARARDRLRGRRLRDLELPDASFDIVSSTCGDDVRAGPCRDRARARSCDRRGGRIALVNWTPAGRRGPMFAVMAPFQPAPPPSNPFHWGDEQHVRELLGDPFELTFEEHVSTLRHRSARSTGSCSRPATARRRRSPRRSATAGRSCTALGSTSSSASYRADGGIVHGREYLLVLGRRRQPMTKLRRPMRGP